MSEFRIKNAATYFAFPLKAAGSNLLFTGTVWGSLTNTSLVCYSWADGEAPALHTLAGTPTELGSTGEWRLACSQSEMNPDSGDHDYMIIKLIADQINPQTILVDLKLMTSVSSLATQIGTAGAGLTALGGMSAGMKAEVNAEADTALSDYDPPTKSELDAAFVAAISEIDANETKIDALAVVAAAIKAKTDKLPHSIKKNTAISGFKFVMLADTTGDPLAGIATITAVRKLDAGASWDAMVGTITDNGSGVYSIDIGTADTNGDTGVWKFSATGAKTTILTFLTES